LSCQEEEWNGREGKEEISDRPTHSGGGGVGWMSEVKHKVQKEGSTLQIKHGTKQLATGWLHGSTRKPFLP
jgi:hypothetical protein